MTTLTDRERRERVARYVLPLVWSEVDKLPHSDLAINEAFMWADRLDINEIQYDISRRLSSSIEMADSIISSGSMFKD